MARKPNPPQKRWRAQQASVLGLLVSMLVILLGGVFGGSRKQRAALVGATLLVAGGLVLVLWLGERRRHRAAGADALMVVRASVFVPEMQGCAATAASVQNAKFGSLRRWNQNRASGWLTVTKEAIDWTPDGLTRRWRVRPFQIGLATIRTVTIGHIGLKGAVSLNLTDGSSLDLQGSAPSRWRDLFAGLGVTLDSDANNGGS